VATFDFRFQPLYRVLSAPFGITPATSHVEVLDDHLVVRFGPWYLRTPLANIVGCERTGPYSAAKAAGPVRLSLVDRGLTFATNGDAGLCIRFAEPVPAIDPFGKICHPGITVTVDRLDDLQRLLTAPAGTPGPARSKDH